MCLKTLEKILNNENKREKAHKLMMILCSLLFVYF